LRNFKVFQKFAKIFAVQGTPVAHGIFFFTLKETALKFHKTALALM
jgi:hypothetical protein